MTDGFGGAGGLLVGALSGGAGALGGGGGGAAAGPAIFVNLGTLTTVNCTATGLAATGGIGGGTAGNGGSDATAVFNYNGIVNSSATPGPVNGAVAAKTDLWVRLARTCDAMSRFVVSALIGLRNEQIGDAVGAPMKRWAALGHTSESSNRGVRASVSMTVSCASRRLALR